MLIRRDDNPNIDAIAGQLINLGRMARSMPPAWDAAEISHPVFGAQLGERLGRILPGRGLYLDIDPKAVGITRGLPYVYYRTPVMRLLEKVGDIRKTIRLLDAVKLLSSLPLAAITTYDGIIAARAGGKANDTAISKTSYTTVANVYSSVFRAGGFPVAGTYTNIPGGAVHTRASVGAWSFGLTNPTGGAKKYLLTFGYTAAQQINMAILVDLLVAAGNINANVTGNQTINSTALTRNYAPTYSATAGAGVLMTFEVTTALGATASNLTVNSYTDQDGNAAQTTAAEAMTQSAITQRLQPVTTGPFMPLASGDFGVRSVETLAFSAAMGAGVVALNLYYPLAFLPGIAANAYIERNSPIQVDGLTELVVDGSTVIGCITAYVLTNTTSTGVLTGFFRSTEG